MTINDLPEPGSKPIHPLVHCLCTKHKGLTLHNLIVKAYRKMLPPENHHRYWDNIAKECEKNKKCYACEIDNIEIPKELLALSKMREYPSEKTEIVGGIIVFSIIIVCTYFLLRWLWTFFM